MILLSFVMAYYWVVFSRMIDARMSGEMARTDPRVFARPFELHRGQALTERQLIDRLNDLGYAHRARAEQPGEFTVGRDALVLIPRDGDHKGRIVRLVFGGRPAKTAEPARIETIELPPDKKTVERVTLDPPLITALVTSEGREKRRDVPLQAIPRADDPGGPRHRGSPLLRPSRRRSDRHRRRRLPQHLRQQGLPGERQHADAAAGQEHVPDAGEDAEAQDDRMVHVGGARDAPHEGPDSPALSERRLARPARLVRHPRRRRGGPALLREGRRQRLASPRRRPSPASSSRRRACRRSTTRSVPRNGATS